MVKARVYHKSPPLKRKAVADHTENSTSDGRCFYVHLTKTGRRIVSQAFRRHAQNLEKAAGALTAEERSELVRLLKKVGLHAQQMTVGD